MGSSPTAKIVPVMLIQSGSRRARRAKMRARKKIVPQLIRRCRRRFPSSVFQGSAECKTAAVVNMALSGAISARSVPVPRSTESRSLSLRARIARIVTGTPTAAMETTVRSCSLLIHDQRSSRSAVIHVTRARRMPAFNRSEAMTTSSFRGELVALRCVEVLMGRVCALGAASAAFALPSSAC